MNQEKVIELARQAGMEVHERKGQIRIGSAVLLGGDSTEQVERFAALVAAHEREECAKACEEISDDYRKSESRLYPEMKTDAETGASSCEHAIRARGPSPK